MGRPAPTSARLLDRDRELGEILERLEAARTGAGSALVVEGPGGIGKTELLLAAAREAREAGMCVLTARGAELEREFAFGVVRQLFDAHVHGPGGEELMDGAAALSAPVFEVSEHAEADERSFAVLHGLYWLCASLADRAPLVVLVDDAHWSDPASLAFLTYLARRVEDLPVAVAVASRPGVEELEGGLLEELLDQPRAMLVRPAPLTRAAVGTLLGAQTGEGPDEAFVDACLTATEGNPFLVRELVREIGERGIGSSAADAERVRELGPRTVARRLLARLGRASPLSVEVVRAVAVLGADADVRRIARLTELPADDVAATLDALEAADVLAGERPVDFVHPIARSAIYAAIPGGERARLHAVAAGLLREEQAPAERIASHVLVTEPAGDRESVSFLVAAARDALARGAPSSAASYLRRALAEPPDPDERPALLAELGSAESLVGDARAIGHLREALEGSRDSGVRRMAALAMARLLVLSGETGRAASIFESAATGPERWALRLEASAVSSGVGDVDTAPLMRERIELLRARAERDADVPAAVFAALAIADAQTSRPADGAAELAMRAVAGSQRRGLGWATGLVAVFTSTGGNPFLLEQLVSEVRAEGIEPTAASASGVASLGPDTVRASVLLRLERLPVAGAPVARALAVLGEHDVSLRDVATMAEVPEDEAADALAALERAGLVAGAPTLRFTHPILRAAIEDDMPAVERSRAHEQAAEMLRGREADPVAVAAHLLLSEPGQGAWAVAALRNAARRAEALGDPATAVRYLERAVLERPDDSELAEVLFELGLAAAHAGDPDAGEHLERAAAAGGSTRLRALHWTAVLHLVGGRVSQAADVLESALADVHEESDAAKPLLETLLAAGLESTSVRTRLGDLFEHVAVPSGAPRTDFERFALITHSFVAVTEQADAGRATELIHQALSVEEHGYYESVMRASVGRPMTAFVLTLLERYDESLAILDRLVRAARDYGDRSAVGVFLAERAWARYRSGAVESAEADAAEALRIARDATRARGHAPIAAATAVLAGLERERPLEELEAVMSGLPPAGDPDTIVQEISRWRARGCCSPTATRAAAADAAFKLDPRRTPGVATRRHSSRGAPWRRSRSRSSARRSGRSSWPARSCASPSGWARRAQSGSRSGPWPSPDRSTSARRGWRRRSPRSRTAGRSSSSRGSACELGAELRRKGERGAARDVLRRAHTLASECGGTRLANRARDELGRSGARLMREPASGVEGLTPSEVRVAELAAEGLTNREVGAGAVRLREDRRDAPGARLPQARHQVPARAARRARRTEHRGSPLLGAEQRRGDGERHLGACAQRVGAHPLVRRVGAATARAEAVDGQVDAAGRCVAGVARAAALGATIGRPSSPDAAASTPRSPRVSPSPARRAACAAPGAPPRAPAESRRARGRTPRGGRRAGRRAARRPRAPR